MIAKAINRFCCHFQIKYLADYDISWNRGGTIQEQYCELPNKIFDGHPKILMSAKPDDSPIQ